jgi:hypothetical protein
MLEIVRGSEHLRSRGFLADHSQKRLQGRVENLSLTLELIVGD